MFLCVGVLCLPVHSEGEKNNKSVGLSCSHKAAYFFLNVSDYMKFVYYFFLTIKLSSSYFTQTITSILYFVDIRSVGQILREDTAPFQKESRSRQHENDLNETGSLPGTLFLLLPSCPVQKVRIDHEGKDRPLPPT